MNRNFVLGLFFLLFSIIPKLSFAEFLVKDLLISNSNGEIKLFTVEIADNDETRSIGLMERENIPLGTGMLFIWEEEVTYVSATSLCCSV